MPLRDHFRSTPDGGPTWEGLHGGWPMMIVAALSRSLPRRYVAEPRVHLGPFYEVDVGATDSDESAPFAAESGVGDSTATAVWAPPRPTYAVAVDPPDEDVYEVRVFETSRRRRLVAAIEIISPANKDRPEQRRAFVAKCAALLGRRVSVALVDLVTTRHFNLYGDLLDLIGQADPSLGPEPPPCYATSCRWLRNVDSWRFETWSYPLAVGRPLPTLPLWLADDFAVPLELEASYEETCRILRIP